MTPADAEAARVALEAALSTVRDLGPFFSGFLRFSGENTRKSKGNGI